MAVRTDDVQLRLSFITDESRALADTLKTTKQYTQEIAAASKRVQEHEKELKKTGTTEARRAELLRKIREEQNQIALAEKRIVEEGKKVEKLDLNKVAPVQLEARLKQVRAEMKLIGDQGSAAFKSLQAESTRLNAQLKEVYQTANKNEAGGGLLAGLGTFGAFAGRALPIIGAVVAAFQSLGAAFSKTSNLEQLTIAFETFLGSADKAKAVIADLKAFEVKTPFEADQVNSAGRALLAFGVSTKDLIPTLTRIGDVASGTGKDFNELTLIYGKAKTQGIIQGEELNQLAEAGIPIYAELATVLKVNESQIRKLGEQGKIQFKDLEQVFKNLTGEGGRFGGLMERQSASLGGLYSTLQSALGNLLTDFGTALAPLAKGVLQLAISGVQRLGTALIALGLTLGAIPKFIIENRVAIAALIVGIAALNGQMIAASLNTLRLAVVSKASAIATTAQTIATNAQAVAQRLLNAAMTANPIGLVVAGLAALVAIFSTAYQHSEGFRSSIEGLGRVGKEIFKILTEAAAAFARGFSQLMDGEFRAAAESFAEGITKSNPIGIAFTQGQRLGQAFNEGYNSSMVQAAEERAKLDLEGRAEEAAARKRDAEEEKAQLEEQRKAAKERAFQEKKAREERRKTFEAFIKTEIAGIEAQATKRDLIAESFYLRGIISEERYQEALAASQERSYQEQLDLYKKYGQGKTNEALAVQNKLLGIEQGRSTRNTAPLAALPTRQPGPVTSEQTAPGLNTARQTENTALAAVRNESEELQAALQDRFTNALISEQDYELQRLELKRQFLEEELAILRASAEPQYEEIEKREEEKNKISFEIGKKRLENQKRLQELEQQVLNTSTKALGDLFSSVADMLSQDEKRKSKHAGIIKALEIANIQVNLVSEVSSIYANAQESPVAKLLGSGAGYIIATIQAAAATLRAGTAIGKIQAQKFERGSLMEFAKFGYFGGRPHSAGGTKGYFDDGTAIEVERDEAFAVINKRNAPMLRLLSRINAAGGHGEAFFERGGIPKLATGGLPNINTTPSAAVAQAVTGGSGNYNVFVKASELFYEAVQQMPREVQVKARVVYTEIEQAGGELDAVRGDAAL